MIDRTKMTRTRSKYNNGERVDIISGKYKGLSATYLGKYGKVMCSIAIDGDNKDFRHIWLTSIERRKEDEKEGVNTEDSKGTTDNNHSNANKGKQEERQKAIVKVMESVYEIQQQLDTILMQLHGLLDDE